MQRFGGSPPRSLYVKLVYGVWEAVHKAVIWSYLEQSKQSILRTCPPAHLGAILPTLRDTMRHIAEDIASRVGRIGRRQVGRTDFSITRSCSEATYTAWLLSLSKSQHYCFWIDTSPFSTIHIGIGLPNRFVDETEPRHVGVSVGFSVQAQKLSRSLHVGRYTEYIVTICHIYSNQQINQSVLPSYLPPTYMYLSYSLYPNSKFQHIASRGGISFPLLVA